MSGNFVHPIAHEGTHTEPAPLDALDRVPLFSCLAPDQRRVLASLADIARVEPHQQIVAEGTTPTALFVVVSGAVDIARHYAAGTERHQIRSLGPGETFGELGLIEELPTSASVYATAPTSLLVIPLAALRRVMAEDVRFEHLFRGLAQQLNSRLRSLTDVTVAALEREVAELRSRVSTGTLLVSIVAFLSAFTYSVNLGKQLTNAGLQQGVTLAISFLGIIGLSVVILRSGLPLSFWGFTTWRWRAAVREAVVYSGALIALFLAVKWVLIHSVESWRDVPLYHLWNPRTSGDVDLRMHLLQLTVYVLVVVPLQEIGIRGGVQGALQEFLTGPRRALWAIVTSNLIFSVTHTFLSPQFALLTLIPGLLWGWLYYRERTLIGPMLSHAIVGVAAMDLMGVFELYK